MENRQQQILSEIKEMMSSIRVQLEQLDAKMAELQYEVDPQTFTADPIDLSLDDFPMAEVAEETVAEMFEEPVAETPEEPQVELSEEPVAVVVPEPVVEEAADESDDDLPFFDEPVEEPVADVFEEPELVVEMFEEQESEPAVEIFDEPVLEPETVTEPLIINEAAQASIARPVVLDAMIAKQAWRTDMPGAPVRDIRSAISLNDRVLFINRLFGEDPVNFQETLNVLNQMGSLDEAVAYLVEAHPSWNLESELVYRFMMALRRKLN